MAGSELIAASTNYTSMTGTLLMYDACRSLQLGRKLESQVDVQNLKDHLRSAVMGSSA
jgi:hypothetical protein